VAEKYPEMLCIGPNNLSIAFAPQPHIGTVGGETLQRLFSTFPGGRPGAALLLMRAVVGVTAAAQGILYLVHGGNQTLAVLLACLALAGCGACVLVGFLTPIASVAVAILNMAMTLSVPPIAAGNSLDGTVAFFELIVMAAAIALLGPGAFSLDARLFGRHEIVIPPSSRTPES
jgi:putative oxidoreductase